MLVIKVSIAGFVAHLALVFLSRWLSHPPLIITVVGRNYLSAIATPFSFILFSEVLTLLAAPPPSSSPWIASQFRIVSPIFIRQHFKCSTPPTPPSRQPHPFHLALPSH